ncbi:MAG: Nif3-like dinuclear metal center hexameric protein [Clostridiales Family XIII bacterium]|jgi:dinuclear metal center YbgI/SA1388 family protein|nr:Nif3-like dinuclear metal center hexameric protein [Clostridiales Family XIII bacterium]
MPIERTKLIQQIERIAPPERALDWDNTGIQISVGGPEIKRVLVALDVTEEIIREARALNADFIVAHHPLIFNKLRKIDCAGVVGGQIIELIRAGISVYAAHTSFDVVYGGNNDYLCEVLELQKIRRVLPEEEGAGEILGKIGNLKREMRLAEVCDLLRERLNISRRLPAVGDPGARILKVGLCTGGGGEQIEAFAANGCSLYITGDVRHHEALLAEERGICLIDAGHFDTEWLFVKNFAEKLKAAVGDVAEVYESKHGKDPFIYI